MSTSPDTPIRSPSYPVMSLADAISAVHKIEAQYRSSKVDREIAAKMIGYSGLSGPANKALAALAQYGLVERAGKGEMRVTDRARAILHPEDAGEKRRELEAAALEPALFREMKERWPDVMPPEEAVISYFNRRGFNPSAIRPAARAYLQTLLYLEEESDSDSHGVANEHAPHAPTAQVPTHRGGSEASAPLPMQSARDNEVAVMQGERVIFVDEASPGQYLKVVASGELDDVQIEALEDFIKRRKKRIFRTLSGAGLEPAKDDLDDS